MRPLKVSYILMRFPAATETFAASDISALRKQGVEVSVYPYRRPPARFKSLLNERGLLGLTVKQPSFTTLFRAPWMTLVKPALFARLFFWTIKQNYRHPLHWLRSTVLIPRTLEIFCDLSKEQPDIVHLFWGHYPSLIGFLVMNYLPRTVLSHFLGAYDLSRHYNGTRYVARRADVVWTHSESNLPAIYALGIPQNKVFISYRGIDLNKIEKIKASGIERIPRRIATAGCLEAPKRFDEVIDVFGKVVRNYPNSSLVIMGDGPERNRLKALASSNGLSHKIHFTGHISHDDVLLHMAEADIFLFLSTKESERLPNVVKEAMGCGCIVIASKTQGIKELINKNEDGFIFSFEDKENILNAIFEIFSDKLNKNRMRERALFNLQNKFNLHKNMNRYIAVWNKLKEKKCCKPSR